MNRKAISGPRIVLALILVAIGLAIYFAARPSPVPVDIAQVSRGPVVATIEDEGETRVVDLFAVAAPATGRLLRVPLKPGDTVIAGRTVVARIAPAVPDPLSSRRYAEVRATIESLEAQRAAAAARVRELRSSDDLAGRELARVEQLARRGFAATAALDRARAARSRSSDEVAEAREALDAAGHALDAARAQLIVGDGGSRVIEVKAPVGGRVMRVPQESERVVNAGAPLVEIGDPGRLEIVTDLLSADAVRVRPGAPVLVEAWGGEKPLKGRVRLIEPYGFTKISALGVEEQRVNVVIDLAEPRERWARLGHGYRVVVKVELSSIADAIRIPVSALFRSGGRWSAFQVDDRERARLITLQIGAMNDEVAEVRSGLAPGARVILHPSDKVGEGKRVQERRY